MSFTFKEWQEEYMNDIPVKPYSESDNAEQWAKIAYYLENKLQEAFSVGFVSGYEGCGWHYLKNGDVPPNDDKQYFFCFEAENKYKAIMSDTWKNQKNNRHAIAWKEFNRQRGYVMDRKEK